MDYTEVGMFGQDLPNVSPRNDSTSFEKNVTVLKHEDVIETNGPLLLPNNLELAQIKKKEGRYKSRVQFNKEMDEIAVRERLKNDLPILKDKRFCCAARKNQGLAALDFVGNRRVWDGQTIRRRLPGSSALFILIKKDEEDFNGFHDTEVQDFDLDKFVDVRLSEEQTRKNEKFRESQVAKDVTDSSGQTDSGACSEDNTAIEQPESTPVREAKMDPSEGPLTGGGMFTAEVDIELPQSMEIGWAAFGRKAVKVKVTADRLSIFGKEIPDGDKPGPVSVIFTTLYGDLVAKGIYTYKERRPEYPKNNVQNKFPKRTLNDIAAGMEETLKRLKSLINESQGSEEKASENYYQTETLFQLVDGLRRMVDTVASNYSSTGPYVSGESWEEIAVYLKEIAKRLPVEDETKPLLLAGDVEKKQTQSVSNQVAEDQVSEEEYLGEAETFEQDSESESTNDKEHFNVKVFKKVLKDHSTSEKGYLGDTEISEDAEGEHSDGDLHLEPDTDEGDVIIDPRSSVVTELQLSDISDDVGACWRELGPKLDISAAKIQNLDDDYCCNRDKANALLLMWKQKEGSSAVAERLVDALESIGKKCIAEKLLGGDDLPRGHVISLTVIHELDAGLDKVMVCEDAQGIKYTLKPFNGSDKLLNSEETIISKRLLETVVVAIQESLKRYISSELQDLRFQMKERQLACGNIDTANGVHDASKGKIEPISSLLNEEVDPPNDESVEKLLQTCEEDRNYYEKMFDGLIKLTAGVAQQSEDSENCIQLLDYAKELRREEKALFLKIESVCTQNQLSDEKHADRTEELQKWKTQHEVQFKEVEKFLSGLSDKQRLPSRQKSLPERKGYGRKSPRRYLGCDLPKETGAKKLLLRLKSGDKKP